MIEINGAEQDEAIIESLLPGFEDNKKTKYLSYRATGFTIREATELTGIHEHTLRRWRAEDDEFYKLDRQAVTLRKTIGNQFVMAEFMRNMRLVMEKDAKVLWKAAKELEMTEADQKYLRAIRGYYTPQQLSAMKAVLSGKDAESPNQFNFTQVVMQMARQPREPI